MSQSKSKYEAERWWLSAKEDLEVARALHEKDSLEAIEKAAFFFNESRKLMKNE